MMPLKLFCIVDNLFPVTFYQVMDFALSSVCVRMFSVNIFLFVLAV